MRLSGIKFFIIGLVIAGSLQHELCAFNIFAKVLHYWTKNGVQSLWIVQWVNAKDVRFFGILWFVSKRRKLTLSGLVSTSRYKNCGQKSNEKNERPETGANKTILAEHIPYTP